MYNKLCKNFRGRKVSQFYKCMKTFTVFWLNIFSEIQISHNLTFAAVIKLQKQFSLETFNVYSEQH